MSLQAILKSVNKASGANRQIIAFRTSAIKCLTVPGSRVIDVDDVSILNNIAIRNLFRCRRTAQLILHHGIHISIGNGGRCLFYRNRTVITGLRINRCLYTAEISCIIGGAACQ